MRKKPTFEELANSTLVKPAVRSAAIPYIPPNDSTFAVTELRQKMAEMQAQEVAGEQYRADTTAAAREFGATREFFEDLTKGVITEGGQMHQAMVDQHARYADAATRPSQLQQEAIMREHLSTREQIFKTNPICNRKWPKR